MARGYIFEVAKGPELLGHMDETDFYGLSGHEFSYVENMDAGPSKDCVAAFLKSMGRIAETGVMDAPAGSGDAPVPYFILRDESKMEYFRSAFEKFKQKADAATLGEFSGFTWKAWELRNLVDDHTGDAVYFDGGCGSALRTLDWFIRSAETGVKYYVGSKAVLMH